MYRHSKELVQEICYDLSGPCDNTLLQGARRVSACRMSGSPVIAASIPREGYVWLGNVFLPLAADIGMSMRTNPPLGVSKGKRATVCPVKQVKYYS